MYKKLFKEKDRGKITPELLDDTKQALKEEILKELNTDTNQTRIVREKQTISFPEIGGNVSYGKEQTEMNLDTLDLFPDIRTAINIAKSVVISGNLSYAVDHYYPPAVAEGLDRSMSMILNKKYHFQDILPKDFEEANYTVGSVAYLTLPHHVLSDFSRVNKSVYANEAAVERVALRRRAIEIGDRTLKLGINITDNPGVILAAEDHRRYKELKVKDALGVYYDAKRAAKGQLPANEAERIKAKKKEDEERKVEEELSIIERYKNILIPRNKYQIDPLDGLHMRLDANSVVPVKLLNDTKPVGYLVLMDEEWRPLSTNTLEDLDRMVVNDRTAPELREEIRAYKSEAKQISGHRKEKAIDYSDEEIYNILVQDEVSKLFKNSGIASQIKPQNLQIMSRIMFRRAISRSKTNILYIPEEFLAYYSFRERKDGTGKSLLEETRIISSMRAMITFVKLRSDIERAIPRKKINIKLDKNIKNVGKVMSGFIDSYNQSFNKTFAWGATSIPATANYVQQLGISYHFDHPEVPYNEVDVATSQYTGGEIDTDFLNKLSNDLYRYFGLTRQMIDDSSNDGFATIQVLNNELSKQELTQVQKLLLKNVTQHVRKVLKIDAKFNEQLRALFRKETGSIINTYPREIAEILHLSQSEDGVANDDLIEWLCDDFFDKVDAKLPELRSEDEDELAKRFAAYSDSLDLAIDSLIANEEALPAALQDGPMPELMRNFKVTYKQMLLRKWMRDHNYLTEVADLVLVKDGMVGSNFLETYVENVKATGDILIRFDKEVGKVSRNIQKKLEKLHKETNTDNKGKIITENEHTGIAGVLETEGSYMGISKEEIFSVAFQRYAKRLEHGLESEIPSMDKYFLDELNKRDEEFGGKLKDKLDECYQFGEAISKDNGLSSKGLPPAIREIEVADFKGFNPLKDYIYPGEGGEDNVIPEKDGSGAIQNLHKWKRDVVRNKIKHYEKYGPTTYCTDLEYAEFRENYEDDLVGFFNEYVKNELQSIGEGDEKYKAELERIEDEREGLVIKLNEYHNDYKEVKSEFKELAPNGPIMKDVDTWRKIFEEDFNAQGYSLEQLKDIYLQNEVYARIKMEKYFNSVKMLEDEVIEKRIKSIKAQFRLVKLKRDKRLAQVNAILRKMKMDPVTNPRYARIPFNFAKTAQNGERYYKWKGPDWDGNGMWLYDEHGNHRCHKTAEILHTREEVFAKIKESIEKEEYLVSDEYAAYVAGADRQYIDYEEYARMVDGEVLKKRYGELRYQEELALARARKKTRETWESVINYLCGMYRQAPRERIEELYPFVPYGEERKGKDWMEITRDDVLPELIPFKNLNNQFEGSVGGSFRD